MSNQKEVFKKYNFSLIKLTATQPDPSKKPLLKESCNTFPIIA